MTQECYLTPISGSEAIANSKKPERSMPCSAILVKPREDEFWEPVLEEIQIISQRLYDLINRVCEYKNLTIEEFRVLGEELKDSTYVQVDPYEIIKMKVKIKEIRDGEPVIYQRD